MIKTGHTKAKAMTRRGQRHVIQRAPLPRRAGDKADCPMLLSFLLACAEIPGADQVERR